MRYNKGGIFFHYAHDPVQVGIFESDCDIFIHRTFLYFGGRNRFGSGRTIGNDQPAGTQLDTSEITDYEDQDIRQSIVIAAASIAAHSAQADSIMDEIVRFVEQNTEAEIVGEEREIR